MLDKIDVRGMSCPQPVLMTKKAIKNSPDYIEIIIDNNTAKENVSRFLNSNGYKVEISKSNEDYILKGTK